MNATNPLTESFSHPHDRLLRLPEVIGNKRKGIIGYLSMSAASWWAGIAKGIYPRGIKQGARMTCWRLSDILALISRLSSAAQAQS